VLYKPRTEPAGEATGLHCWPDATAAKVAMVRLNTTCWQVAVPDAPCVAFLALLSQAQREGAACRTLLDFPVVPNGQLPLCGKRLT
jgi:hypothetical protein